MSQLPYRHLGALLDSAIARAGDGFAVVHNNHRMTYRELGRHVQVFAGQLHRAGVGPGDRVAVLLPNSCEFLISAFALWSLGSILVPIHTKAIKAEILRYIQDCEVMVVVVDHRLRKQIEELGAPSLRHIISSRPDEVGFLQES